MKPLSELEEAIEWASRLEGYKHWPERLSPGCVCIEFEFYRTVSVKYTEEELAKIEEGEKENSCHDCGSDDCFLCNYWSKDITSWLLREKYRIRLLSNSSAADTLLRAHRAYRRIQKEGGACTECRGFGKIRKENEWFGLLPKQDREISVECPRCKGNGWEDGKEIKA